MKRPLVLLALGAVVAVLLGAPRWAEGTPPHTDVPGIQCLDCHAMHGDQGSLVPRGVEQDLLCRSCHNPTGTAAELSDVAMHADDDGELVVDCGSCHFVHSPSESVDEHPDGVTAPNLALIRADTARYVPGALEPAVFQIRPDHFAFPDDNPPYNGICQTCHRETDVHRNDGSAEHSHGIGQVCTACHPHAAGFMPVAEGGKSHDTHLSSVRGPRIGCADCHMVGDYGLFVDGEPLATTSACDSCHSPSGDYDGVDDPVIGAKPNWTDGVYVGDALAAGKQMWCAGCHDNAPANSAADGAGVAAPSVVGDEKAQTEYGIGYGFYVTGHGLAAADAYPATGDRGAGLSCTACHDPAWKHIDGVARSYRADVDYGTFAPECAAYQAGFRLADVATGYDGRYPLHVPRTGHVTPPGFRMEWEFALCFQCHDAGALFNGGDPATGRGAGTDFRAVSDGTPSVGGDPKPTPGTSYSMHDVHTWGANGPVGAATPQYDSDHDGTADSRMTCVACHNVHGSPSPAMIRHGELISTPGTLDRVPALDFHYTPEGDPPLRSVSTGGTMRFIGAGLGTVAKNGVCAMCHNDGANYVRSATDAPGPRMSDMDPPHGAVNVPVDGNLTFTLSDDGAGIDWSSFAVELTGDQGFSGIWTAADVGVVSAVGTPGLLDVTIAPDMDFGEGEVITAVVAVDDLAQPPNALVPPVWSFTTFSPEGGVVVLHPSGLSENPGGFATVGGYWPTVLDVDDGDGTYVHACCGPPGKAVYLEMDDPVGLDGVIIDSVTLYASARFLEGPWPGAVPREGNVRVGFSTGGEIQWTGGLAISASGDYELVASSPFTSDADGEPFDAADIAALIIAVNRSLPGPGQLRVTEAFAVVEFSH